MNGLFMKCKTGLKCVKKHFSLKCLHSFEADLPCPCKGAIKFQSKKNPTEYFCRLFRI